MAHSHRHSYNRTRRRASHSSRSGTDKAQRLAKNTPVLNVTIHKIGSRGDGIGRCDDANSPFFGMDIFVPYTLVGEKIRAQPVHKTGQGVRAELIELTSPSQSRREPSCEVWSRCGGCQFQHMNIDAYHEWKHANVVGAFSSAGLHIDTFASSFWAGDHERRRAKFAWRRTSETAIIGFVARHSHYIVPVTSCTVLDEQLKSCLPALSTWLMKHMTTGQTGHIHINMLDKGADIVLSMDTAITSDQLAGLSMDASHVPAVRVSIREAGSEQAHPLYSEATPLLSSFGVAVQPPPAAFLQSCVSAEQAMRQEVSDAVQNASHILDLFCGCGTFSLGLASQKRVIQGFDSDPEAISAFTEAARTAGYGQFVTAAVRNLFERPLHSSEMTGYQAAIIDPPRQGAAAQIEQICSSSLERLVMISCNPFSLSRDVKTLCDAGFQLLKVRLIDQFVWSAHSEVIAVLHRDKSSH